MIRKIKLGFYEICLPQILMGRITLGALLILGGLFWFLPILGLWMLPLGLAVLSHDIPVVRAWRRRAFLCWRRQLRGKGPSNHEPKRSWLTGSTSWSANLAIWKRRTAEKNSAAARTPPNISGK
jgi:hypothetical protein